MCGPEGHTERQCDDSGVDGPRALDGHLGETEGHPFRLLTNGAAPPPSIQVCGGCQFPTYLMALQFLIQKENPTKRMHKHRRDTKLHTQSRKMDMGLAERPGVNRIVSMAAEQRPQQAHKPHLAILPHVAVMLNVFFYCAGSYDKVLLITYVQMILLSH